MIKCEVLGKEFTTKEDMFKALKDNKDQILSLKKSAIKHSEGISLTIKTTKHGTETKGDPIEVDKDANFIYPVINTTNIMDSHKDVHFPGIWNKSISEQKSKVYYAVNHKLEIGSIIAYPKDVEIFTEDFTFRELGKEVDGTTQALVYKVKVQDYANKDALAIIENKLPAQNSVRMQYIKVQMGVNSTDEAFKEEKAYYDKHIDGIANKEEVEADGYFFGVHEAKISQEGSLVLQGSNSVTPILYASEPHKSTHEPKTQEELKAEADATLLAEYEYLKYVKL